MKPNDFDHWIVIFLISILSSACPLPILPPQRFCPARRDLRQPSQTVVFAFERRIVVAKRKSKSLRFRPGLPIETVPRTCLSRLFRRGSAHAEDAIAILAVGGQSPDSRFQKVLLRNAEEGCPIVETRARVRTKLASRVGYRLGQQLKANRSQRSLDRRLISFIWSTVGSFPDCDFGDRIRSAAIPAGVRRRKRWPPQRPFLQPLCRRR